jgi:phenylacetic acid degradation operon negative regulatory protein
MVRQGWLHPLRLSTGPGYLLTPKAARRLDEAASRIYRTRDNSWDGRFDLVVIDPPTQRADRGRLASSLSFLGYGAIDTATWVAARPTDEVETLLDEAGIRFERFTASHSGGVDGAVALVRRAWNLAEIGAAYEEFVRELSPMVSSIGSRSDDEEAYAARFRLVHAWRTFLFRDPQLPPELLPDRWPGSAAADFFDGHAARLRPAADRFVDRCLDLAASRLPLAAS